MVWRTFFDTESTVSEEARSEYDGLGRLWRQHRYDGKVVEYAYDLKGNRSKVTDPDGVETSYAYDEADRLETVTTPRGAVGYGYWPDGLRKATGLPNGLSEGRCYDKTGQLTAIVTRAGAVGDTCPDTGEDRSRFRYAYDANGNRLSQQEWRTDPGTQELGAVEETTYGYDGLDRLVGVQYPGRKAELYRLDAVGNRTGERELAGVSLSGVELVSFEPPAGATVVRDVTSTFNRADWLLSLADQKDPTRDVTLGWTASGELLAKTTATVSRSLTWDGRGALVSVTDNGTEVGRYDYDADGLRVKRKTAAENVEYVLDEAHVLQEADAAIQEHPSYRRYHYGAEPVLVVDGGTGRFIGTDALGSPTDLTSTTGRVEAKRQYDAWGRYRNGTAPGAGEAKLGFTGHQFDPETGLIYARARYYDPEIGRFISRDSFEGRIEEAPSLHRFAYAWMNPQRFQDATGHDVGQAERHEEEKKEFASVANFQELESWRNATLARMEVAHRRREEVWAALWAEANGSPDALKRFVHDRQLYEWGSQTALPGYREASGQAEYSDALGAARDRIQVWLHVKTAQGVAVTASEMQRQAEEIVEAKRAEANGVQLAHLVAGMSSAGVRPAYRPGARPAVVAEATRAPGSVSEWSSLQTGTTPGTTSVPTHA